MSNDEIIARLKNDEDYYGEFGKQYLSNSKIDSLLNNPLSFNDESEKTSAPIRRCLGVNCVCFSMRWIRLT